MDFNLNRESVNQILGIPHHDELSGRGRAVRKRLEPDIWDNYYKFAFVRNPWDRAVSSWKMLDKETAFPDFVNKIPALLKAKEKTYNHERWHVCHQYIHTVDFNNKNVLDFIGRFENIESDFQLICNRLGLSGISLPHRNQTNHKHYTEYYDDVTRDMVARIYKKDIKYFEYTFDGFKNDRIG